ncbi:MAG: cation diffusion facilitator family transporter [Acidimicrobiales bacterium]
MVTDPAWGKTARLARRLAWVSLVWMTMEGALGLFAGYASGSIALVGWAFGSLVEGLASAIVIWRFTGSRAASGTSERRAQQAVAISFCLLVPYITAQAIADLVGGDQPQTTVIGIALTLASVIVMPALGVSKHRLGARLDSGATAGEGTQNYLCAAQAAAVLVALAVNAVSSAGRWVDPVIALVIAAWSVREGVEAWRGEGCC